jgi:hypothetical protein
MPNTAAMTTSPTPYGPMDAGLLARYQAELDAWELAVHRRIATARGRLNIEARTLESPLAPVDA